MRVASLSHGCLLPARPLGAASPSPSHPAGDAPSGPPPAGTASPRSERRGICPSLPGHTCPSGTLPCALCL